MPNRLASATSPYLLQHRDNPVDWHEWGAEAFDEARRRDVPVLLSVGYSACHWCHVMAHESFEDDETAALMNRQFVNVKVDREERPDVDRIYMDAVQAMTGRGGWPMTVFMAPNGRPFFAGTYFPKSDRPGMPSFTRVLAGVTDAWANRRDELDEQAGRLTAALSREVPAADTVDPDVVDRARAALVSAFDPDEGGFGGAPKFPQAPNLELLLRLAALGRAPDAVGPVTTTLDAMARGGIYDHLGGGFARYSVDRAWLVPHFEKMLYDNALLARTYLRGAQVTGTPEHARVATETLDYLLRDMTHADGGFFSAEDADSEGEEGTFYVFGWDELHSVLGADAPLVTSLYGATEVGNFEGKNILHRKADTAAVAADHGVSVETAETTLRAARTTLQEHRAGRIRPGLDDKVIASWNGLAMRTFAEAGAILGSPRYTDAARRNARFVLEQLRRPDGRLLRSWRNGRATIPGFCEDYAAVAVGLMTLYAATGEHEWFAAAEELVHDMIDLFADPVGGFYATGSDAETLIARPKNLMDNPTPSDNSLAAEALLMLTAYTGDAALGDRFAGIMRAAGHVLEHYPTAAGHLLAVYATSLAGPHEVAIVGDPGAAATIDLARAVWGTFRPDCVVARHSGAETEPVIPLLEGRVPHRGDPVAYVCHGFVCDLPTGSPDVLATQLDRPGRPGGD